MTTSSSTALRVVLECLTDTIPAIDQPDLLAKLTSAFPHSIVPAPSELVPLDPIDSYNCFEFALGVLGRKEVRVIPQFFQATFCGGAFVPYLAERSLVPVASPSDRDLVLYHDGQQFTHAGVIHGDRVLSKWGKGLLWLHGALELPARYGSTISCYRTASPEEVLVKFLAFARQREGVSIINHILESGSASNVDA